MAEPFSLAVNVVQIIGACAATIQKIDHLIKQYRDAAKKLESLASEAELGKALLGQLDRLLTDKLSFFAGKLQNDPDLKSAIDRTLTGCWTVFLLLHKELGKLTPEGGTDASVIKKIRLLFNDEIIQDYRSQIRGHIQGLESVLVCLQAQTISETHEILQRASKTLDKIAAATTDIRKQHKEYSFPESVYEGYTTFEEDKQFDIELLSTPAYRAALQNMRHNSLLSDDTLVTAGASSHSGKRPNKDFLSDQPLEEQRVSSQHADLLSSEEPEDLISFGETGNDQPGKPITSPSAELLQGLLWRCPSEPTASHLLDEPFELTANVNDIPGEHVSVEDRNTSVPPDSHSSVSKALVDLSNHEIEGNLDEHTDRRDSAHPKPPSVLPLVSTDDKFSILPPDGMISVPIPEEKEVSTTLVAETNDGNNGSSITRSASSSTNSPCLDATSTNSSREIPITPVASQTQDAPFMPNYPISPGGASLRSIDSLPSRHRLAEPPVGVPLDDECQEKLLLDVMPHCTTSTDPSVQLDWAEDVLQHRDVGIKHAKRLAAMKVRKKKETQAPMSDREALLMTEATRIVRSLRASEHGKAYFLNAKYILPPDKAEYEYQLARGKGYHRALFYLGTITETNGSAGDALRRYQEGAKHLDSACLHRLAQAHLDGQLNMKINSEKGTDLLRQAVKVADKDFPDSLHHLAELHIAPLKSKVLKFSSSKPQVERDPIIGQALFRRAALLDHGPSQLRLGKFHLCGQFEVKSAKKPARMLSRSATNSSRRESVVSVLGTGDTEIDVGLAMHYLHLAARRGQPEADYEIARNLFPSGGIGGDRDDASKQYDRLAYTHATRALFGGVSLAFGLLGRAHEEGIGCKKDLTLAEKYYYDGGKRGDDWARGRSDALRNQGVGLDGNELSYVRGPGIAKPTVMDDDHSVVDEQLQQCVWTGATREIPYYQKQPVQRFCLTPQSAARPEFHNRYACYFVVPMRF
ncbi:hypothetical protein EJ08DRAFT_660546 [Tothia fuscella]|uniref:Fungal N-terminal domain-containing protein n=1 Tax=Tothia fuscella TaxID=1048955 RepID=A0A9P4NSI6_9PEZI|nr:hypothetical protein EJ08DRAFT_660546 [Tothia fuscella]